jgi:4-amino-4-deoxy-L-arabinose transferase-like glycosyltransferase
MPSKSHTHIRRHWLTDMACLTLLFLALYLLWLGSYPLFIPDEGRYSEVAREMVANSDFITPRVNGVAFLDKPVLYYWLQATAIYLFGIKEWALRLFPALLGVFGCLATYVCGRISFSRRTGIISAIILATTPLYFGSAHYANLDLEVAVLISCSLFSLMIAFQSTNTSKRWYLAAYCFAALAFLTKGLIGAAFPALIGGMWIALQQRWAILKNMHLVLGVVVFLAIVLPWYALVQHANPEFLHYFFVTQQVTRFLSAAEFNNPTPVWFYLPIVLLGFLPWTGLLVQTLYRGVLSRHPAELFLLIWASVVFVFFSIPHSKTISYILPIFPPLALLVGQHISLNWEKLKLFFTLAAISSTLFLLIVMFNAADLNDKSTKPLLAELKTMLNPEDEVINYFKFYQDIPIYLERRVTLVADWHSPEIAQRDNWVRELWYGMPFQNTQDWLIDENTFWQRFNGNKRVFVFLNDNYFDQFKARATHYFIISKHNDIILLSNLPENPKLT